MPSSLKGLSMFRNRFLNSVLFLANTFVDIVPILEESDHRRSMCLTFFSPKLVIVLGPLLFFLLVG